MRSDLLQKYPSSSVRVFVVWFNMLAGDSRDLVDRRVLNDPRVINFYDPNRLVGSWFAAHNVQGGGIVWDAYFLYGPDASWSAEPGPLLSSGGSVISSTFDLAAAFHSVA